MNIMNRNITLALLLAVGLGVRAQQLTLQQVRERALAHNIQMRTADNAIAQAREQKKEALTSYFPQVKATGIGFKVSIQYRPSFL